MNKKIIIGTIVVISIILSIYGYILLPETVVVQVALSGNPSNIYPKILAIILPFYFRLVEH